jgi:threonine synthase
MLYYSTNHKSPKVSFEEAILNGIAPDGGLYMPEHIVRLPEEFLAQIETFSLHEIAYQVCRSFFEKTIPPDILRNIIAEALNFEVPLIQLERHVYLLELFHGPTLSFKDFGARLMARITSYLMHNKQRSLVVLVATSGDTGSAVAHAFLRMPHVHVVVLYPQGKVSKIQEQQLTTMGHNVTAIEVQGEFDACQELVKEAFGDQELRKQIMLTAANSTNIGRLLPQIIYYCHAYAQLPHKGLPLAVAVPSGNHGNLVAGLMAKRMGIPISQFVDVTNVNDVVPKYLETGIFTPHPSVHTLSCSMDVGHPTNFIRLLDLFGNDIEKMRRELVGASVSDDETKQAIREVLLNHGYLLDPHTAVGYVGLKRFMDTFSEPMNGICLATAHPAKFLDVIQPIVGQPVPLPAPLQAVMMRKKSVMSLPHKYADFRQYLLSLNQHAPLSQ